MSEPEEASHEEWPATRSECRFHIDKGLFERIATEYRDRHGDLYFSVDKNSKGFRTVVDVFERLLTFHVHRRGPVAMNVTVAVDLDTPDQPVDE